MATIEQIFEVHRRVAQKKGKVEVIITGHELSMGILTFPFVIRGTSQNERMLIYVDGYLDEIIPMDGTYKDRHPNTLELLDWE